MKSRIPPEAFEYYVGLGATRGYDAVAKKYGVSKTAVVKLASREGWQEKLACVERKAKERGEERAVESIEAMNARHLRIAQVVQGKALEALKTMPIESAIDAVRALDLSVRQERLIRGEPSERTEISTESILRREFDTWMRESSGPEDDVAEDDAESDVDEAGERPSSANGDSDPGSTESEEQQP